MGVGDIEDLPFGERLQRIRERRGLTREVLAGLVGRSPGWIKKAEKQNVMPNLEYLVRLAKALRLPTVDALTGPMDLPTGLDLTYGHDEAEAIMAAITSWELDDGDVEQVSGADLRHRARAAMRLWQTHPSPREATARLLPQLIRDGRGAMRTLHGQERRVAAAALVESYILAEHWLSWIAGRETMMVIADRAMHTAEEADQPEVLAEAAWGWGNTMRYVDSEASIRLVDRVSRRLRRSLDDDAGDTETAGMWGSLQLHQAITHAQSGREGDALRHLDQARDISRRLPEGWQHPITVFAPYNVDLHGVSVQAELCKGSEGSRLALKIDPETIPGPYRRSRLWLDAARAWWASGDALGAVTALQHACQTSAENMRYSPHARTLAGQLLDRGGLMVAPQARGIAADLELIT